MSIKLDNTTKIPFPTAETWSRFHQNWSELLIKRLGGGYDLMDREDAVLAAFSKLMFRKGIEDYKHIPATEKEWYGCLFWQAKSYLQHHCEYMTTWKRHHQAAARERLIFMPRSNFCNIDGDVARAALFETLHEVCREVGMKDANVEAYIRWYLNGEDSACVAKDLGTTTGNLYVIRNRIEKALAKFGRAKFAKARARLFLEAA